MKTFEIIGVTILAIGLIGLFYTGITTNYKVSMEKGISAILFMFIAGIGAAMLFIRFLIWFFSRWF